MGEIERQMRREQREVRLMEREREVRHSRKGEREIDREKARVREREREKGAPQCEFLLLQRGVVGAVGYQSSKH